MTLAIKLNLLFVSTVIVFGGALAGYTAYSEYHASLEQIVAASRAKLERIARMNE